MRNRTKIICTIGPAVNTREKIVELIRAGMNVARLNFSHGTHEEHLQVIEHLKVAREELGLPLAIMLDTKGPEIRIGKMAPNIILPQGHQWILTSESIVGDLNRVSINGYITAKVISVLEEGVLVQIQHGGPISSNKGVNIPNVSLNLPAVTPQDVVDITFGCHHDIDIIAASFVRCAEHVVTIKKLLAEQGRPEILVIAKIENAEGVQNFDDIVQVADGIMIARGDLGVELPLSQVPILQKKMIRKCCLVGKPTVTATQMLESMINNPRPTRAETSDVANAIYDSTSSVMLSGETAVGKYPIECVRIMGKIIEEAEKDFQYQAFFDHYAKNAQHDVSSSIASATVKTAFSSHARAIFAFSASGSTARLVSRFRPKMPIIVLTPNRKCYHQLAFSWGVVPFYGEEAKDIEEALKRISDMALAQGYVSYGDLVVVTAGSPFGIAGTTNMMMVESIGNVLIRGSFGIGSRVHGKVSIVLSPEGAKSYMLKNRILAIPRCNEQYLPLIQEADGVVLQNQVDDIDSERYLIAICQQIEKPCIVRADGALTTLKEGQLVTMDPDKAIVYKGVVL
jgi:pyruvate kinase